MSCFVFFWRSNFSCSAFSFASFALLIFSSISFFLLFSFTASCTQKQSQTKILPLLKYCRSRAILISHIHTCVHVGTQRWKSVVASRSMHLFLRETNDPKKSLLRKNLEITQALTAITWVAKKLGT